MPKVSVSRKEHFNAAHRLYNKKWSDEKNEEVFGLCSNPNWHGHNYELIVQVSGEVDKELGFVYDLKRLSTIIRETIIDKFDHRNLNLEIPDFEHLIPTVENITLVIYKYLREKIEKQHDIKVVLYETERNFAEYPITD